MQSNHVIQIIVGIGLSSGALYGIHNLVSYFGGYTYLFGWLQIPGVYAFNIILTVLIGVIDEAFNPCKIAAWNSHKSKETAEKAWGMYQLFTNREEYLKKIMGNDKWSESVRRKLNDEISVLGNEVIKWFLHIIVYIYTPYLLEKWIPPLWFYSMSSRAYSGMKLALMISNFCGTIKHCNLNKSTPANLQPHFEMEPGYFGAMICVTFYCVPVFLG